MYGNWDWFMKERDWGHSNNCGNITKYITLYNVIFNLRYSKIPILVVADAFKVPANCTYDVCRVTCTNYTDMPKNLSSNVTAMYVS